MLLPRKIWLTGLGVVVGSALLLLAFRLRSSRPEKPALGREARPETVTPPSPPPPLPVPRNARQQAALDEGPAAAEDRFRRGVGTFKQSPLPGPLRKPKVDLATDERWKHGLDNVVEGDEWESWDGKPSAIETVAKVGSIRLGVRRSAKLLDREAAITTLERLGAEMDRVDRGRQDHPELRAVEYTPILERYKQELAGQMEGEFAVGMPGFTLQMNVAEEEAP